MKYKAVIFDLFGTLVDNLSVREVDSVLRQMALLLSAPPDGFVRLWIDTYNKRGTGVFQSSEAAIEYICRKLRVHPEDTETKLAARIMFDFMARSMTPRPGAIEVLSHLKSDGYKTGLITNCSSEAPAIWKTTSFAPWIDVAVFSCSVGLRKPDPRIYCVAADQLAVEPETCLYVGDGASQELTGASQVGMHPVLIRVRYEKPADTNRLDREEWDGPVISSLRDVLTLVR